MFCPQGSGGQTALCLKGDTRGTVFLRLRWPCCPSSHNKGEQPCDQNLQSRDTDTAGYADLVPSNPSQALPTVLGKKGCNLGMANTPSSVLALTGLGGCVEGQEAHTLSLQHVVGILDLRFFRQGQCPAIKQLDDLRLHFLRHPVPQVLRAKENGKN